MSTSVLRLPTEADLSILYEQQADAEANRLAAVPPRDRQSFFAHWGKILADPNTTKRVIVTDGEVAGHVIVFDRDGHREIGYWLGRGYWGRGLASRAVGEILAIERARPLWAGVMRDNLASLRVVERHGFVRVGETAFADPFTGLPLPGVLLRLDR